MEYIRSVIEIIKMRKSVRTFEENSIDEDTFIKLKEAIAQTNEQMSCKGRIELIGSNSQEGEKKQQLGTYGFISGAKTFLIGIIDKEENNALEFGYWFEKIILHATDLNLGTCWLGGTFKRDDFIQSTELKENEIIAVISPVGIKKEKKRVVESAMRAVINADKRKPWAQLFFENSCMRPLLEYRAKAYADILEMVRLGPSASNKQPWRIMLKDNAYHFFLCRTKGYPTSFYDMQKNDIGIAMCHFELCAKELRLKGSWKQRNDIEASEVLEYIVSWVMEE